MFHWRRYPTFWHTQKTKSDASQIDAPSNITHEDFVYALSQIDSFIDINENDLLRVYDLAIKKSQEYSMAPENLIVGGFYSNGKYGSDWEVRQIVEESGNKSKVDDIIIYKAVAGNGRRNSGYSSRNDFLRWTKHQVIRDEENWKRIDNSS